VLLAGINGRQARYIGYHLAKYLEVPFAEDESSPPQGFWSRWMGPRRN
jgi:hypothetical protein